MFSIAIVAVSNVLPGSAIYQEYKAIVETPSADGLFESARLLRQLLLDEDPLLHQANRTVRLKITFLVNSMIPDPPGLEPDFRMIADGISPSLVPKIATETVNLDAFFRVPILQIDGQWATIRDVVQYVANFAGAVHRSTPNTPMTKSLESVGRSIEVGGAPSVLRSLLGIVDVAIRGCEPLYIKIKESAPG
jgi:hypothetical protein